MLKKQQELRQSIGRRTLRFIGWSVCRTSITANNAAVFGRTAFPGALPAFSYQRRVGAVSARP